MRTHSLLPLQYISSSTLGLIPLACLFLALVACAGDSVNDRREGQLIVCHKGKKSVAVSNADSFLHLDHGDTLGPCPEQK